MSRSSNKINSEGWKSWYIKFIHHTSCNWVSGCHRHWTCRLIKFYKFKVHTSVKKSILKGFFLQNSQSRGSWVTQSIQTYKFNYNWIKYVCMDVTLRRVVLLIHKTPKQTNYDIKQNLIRKQNCTNLFLTVSFEQQLITMHGRILSVTERSRF